MRMVYNYIGPIDKLDAKECRKDAETRFSAQIMTKKYMNVYNRLLEK